MEIDSLDRLGRALGTTGPRRAMLGALLGTAMLGTRLPSVAAKGKAKRQGKRRAFAAENRASGSSVQAGRKPLFEEPVHDEGTAFVVDCGGFEIHDEYVLDFAIKWFKDRDGVEFRGIEKVSGTDTLFNALTGKRLATEPFRNIVHIDLTTDPPMGATTGFVFRITVPGVGAVFLDVGRIVTNQAGNIIAFQAGRHQFYDGEFEGLCAALA
jgi:hypothetical protein